jgi:hypothetical protein
MYVMFRPLRLLNKRKKDIVKGGWRAPPILTSMGLLFHHDGMYGKKVEVYSVE